MGLSALSGQPDLDGEYGRLLLVEDVPGIEDPVLPRCEEHRGPGGAPAAVSQVLRVRAEDHHHHQEYHNQDHQKDHHFIMS